MSDDSDELCECGHGETDHDEDGCTECDCDEFMPPIEGLMS